MQRSSEQCYYSAPDAVAFRRVSSPPRKDVMAEIHRPTVNASDEVTMPVYWRSITSEVEAIGGDERSRLALGLSFREGVLVSPT